MLRIAQSQIKCGIQGWRRSLVSRRWQSGQALAGLREGHEIEGFEVTQVCSVPELHLSPVIRLEHRGTGAQYLHLARSDDRNNAFAVAFRTSPRDSTGLPHILEHVTLCGSKRFPVRDPFFKMLNRSLASFMNAMTGPDFTVYPFSTPNERDYKHLLAVYLDSVFSPLIRDLDFLQEGWRLEHEVVNDPKSPLVLKGVVFNEMKGAFADPQQRLLQDLLSALLPGDTYAHVFGGEPLCIPELTVEDLRKFQARCYHPSNARIVSYGNLPLDQTLQQLQRDHLSHFTRQDPVPGVPREKRWDKPRSVHLTCPPDPLGAASNPDKQATIGLAYLCGDATNIYENFTLQVVSELLLGGPTSALHRALIEPGFGDGFAPCTGFESQTRDTYFSVGLQGVSETQFEEVTSATQAALKKVRDVGFETEHIEAILHRLELSSKTQSASFGLDLALALLPSWNHGADPVEALNYGALVGRLRKEMKDNPKCLQELVDKNLCSNTHQLTITMSPNPDYEVQLAQKEQKLLEDKIAALNESQKTAVLQQGIALQREQMTPSDVSCLPTLTMSDLNPEPEPYQVTDNTLIRGIPAQIYPQPTNGVTHFRALLNTSKIDPQLKHDYLPLFVAIATKMGTSKNDYRQFDRKIQLATSGLGFVSHIIEDPQSTGSFMDAILLSSVCLDRNVPNMLGLWQELLSQPSFSDKDRLETLIKSTAAELANGIAHMGHRYAMLNASSRLTLAAQQREQDSGLQFISKMKEFASASKDDLNEILGNLQELSKVLFSSDICCSVNLGPGDMEDNIVKQLESTLFANLTNPGYTSRYVSNVPLQSPGTTSSQHHVLPLPVGYLGRSIATNVPFTHPDHAALKVAAQLLKARYLHPEVREKGGAYGSGAVASTSGIFSMFSYRDPEASRATGKVFDNSAAWLLNTSNYTSEHVEEAKLSLFQQIDAPTAPGDRGMARFLQNIDRLCLQKHRLALRSVNTDDVLRVAAKYIDTSANPLPVASTLIGPASNELDDTWEVLTG